ncbi:MAG: acetoacetate decarboxylase, partial [Hydrococcus sp. RM1_1_31]|nr:acetoacetate decarboxylase [Hydrococcus sp. RM1_1_31]
DNISVYQGDGELCNLKYQKSWLSFSTGWQQSFSGDTFGKLGSELLLFTSQFKAQLEMGTGNLVIPSASPFARLNLGQPLITLNCQKLELVAGIPKAV